MGFIAHQINELLSQRSLITGACRPEVIVEQRFEHMADRLSLVIVEKSPMLDAEDDTLP